MFTRPVLVRLNTGPPGDYRFHVSTCCVQQPVHVCTRLTWCTRAHVDRHVHLLVACGLGNEAISASPPCFPLSPHLKDLCLPCCVVGRVFVAQVPVEPTCSEDSDHTNTKVCNAVNSGGSSTPSSPSCASASAAAADLAAAFAPFQPQAMAPTPMGAEAAHSPADTQECPTAEQDAPSSPCAPASPAGVAPEDEEAADTAAVVAAAAAAAQACAEAEAAAAAAPVAAASVAADSKQAAYEQAAAEAVAAAAAAEAVAEAAAAAAAALAASESSAAATVGVSASAAAAVAAAPAGPAGVQRPPRIKSKPSNSLMKAAAVVEASSSPKSKKRPAARMAANPGGAHSCTSCGAVVSVTSTQHTTQLWPARRQTRARVVLGSDA